MLWDRLNSSSKRIQAQELSFRQWSVRIERRPFRKSLTISLKPGEPIRVRTDMGTSIARIQNFLMQKEKWIEKSLQSFEKETLRFPEKKLEVGEIFPFLGENLILTLVPTPLNKVFFSVDALNFPKQLRMHLPHRPKMEGRNKDIESAFSILREFYRREAVKFISARIEIWSQAMNLFPKKLSFRNQKTRWGTCSSQGSIQINWRLIAAPLQVIDYILVHELAHLQEMNHSDSFWSLVEKHDPFFEQSEKWLHDHRYSLEFLRLD